MVSNFLQFPSKNNFPLIAIYHQGFTGFYVDLLDLHGLTCIYIDGLDMHYAYMDLEVFYGFT